MPRASPHESPRHRELSEFASPSNESAALLSSGANFTLAIFSCARSAEVSDYSERAGSAIVLGVPSLEEAIAQLRVKGVHLLHPAPSEGPLGRYVAFADPFGTVHELVEVRTASND